MSQPFIDEVRLAYGDGIAKACEDDLEENPEKDLLQVLKDAKNKYGFHADKSTLVTSKLHFNS